LAGFYKQPPKARSVSGAPPLNWPSSNRSVTG